MSIEHTYLQECYPDYRKDAPLPPELMIMVMGMLKETKTYNNNWGDKIEENYVNGKLHGERKVWHDNGELFIEENYVNGKKHGVSTIWDFGGTCKLR
jgi:antitoxin component YwqK of YwqJK toxin-antitoxin module